MPSVAMLRVEAAYHRVHEVELGERECVSKRKKGEYM